MSVKVFGLRGDWVATVVDEVRPAGTGAVTWDVVTSGSGSASTLANVNRAVSRHGISQRASAFRAASLMDTNPATTSTVAPTAAHAHWRCVAFGTAWEKS